MNESPVLLHIWEIPASEEPAAVERLQQLFAEIAKDDAFVSALVLESSDRDSIAAVVEMRTAEDRRRLEAIPAVKETLEHLHGTANIVFRFYNEVARFG